MVNEANSAIVARFIDGGANELYHNGNVKFATTSGGVSITGALTVSTDATITGDLTVSGTTTTINTQTLDVEDKNVVIGKVSSPSDTTADGGGWTLKGASDKTFNWVNSTDAWTSSEHIHLGDNKKLLVGTGSDLSIYHDGTNSRIDNGTGAFILRTTGSFLVQNSGGSEVLIDADIDGAVSLYHNNAKKIETTSGGINVTGAIQVNGAALSTAPTFTATASGTIAADKSLILKTDGKVEQIAETSVSAAQGSEVLPGSTSQNKDYVETFSMGTNRFLATWIRTGDSNKLYGAIGTVTGTTIVYGSEVRISNHTNTRENTVCACYDSSLDVGYIMFQAGSATQMRGIGFTFSGTGSSATFTQHSTQWSNGGTARQMRCVSDQKGGIYMFYGADSSAPKARCATLASNGAVTAGTEISTFGSANYNNYNTADLAYDSAADRVAVVRNNGGQDTDAAILSRSGTLASYSGGASLQGQTRGSEAGVRVIYDTKNDQFLLIFRTYAAGSNNETEGTTFYTNAGKNGWTLGSARFVLSNNRFDDQQADYSESLQKAFFFMQNDSAGNTSVITLTGTGGQGGTYSASMDVAFSYNCSSVAGAALSNGKIVLGQRNSSNRFATKVWQIAYTATNLESDNFIGFSAGSYSDGDTATVKIDSNTTTQSSLTPVKTYYIQRDGTLGIAAATPSVLGGIALSSTKLLIDAHR